MAEQHKDSSLGDHRTRAAAHRTVTVDSGRQLHLAKDVYTKTEIDNKLTTLITGLEHGVSVIDRTNNPPTSPVDDEFYIVGPAPLGAWVGKNNQLAYWDGASWQFTPPQANEAHLVEPEVATYAWNATTNTWVKVANASTSPIDAYTKAESDARFSAKPVAIGVMNSGWGVETGYGIASVQAVPGRPYPGYWRVHLSRATTNWCFHCSVISTHDGPNSWEDGLFTSGRWIDSTTLDLYFHSASNLAATVDPPRISLIVY